MESNLAISIKITNDFCSLLGEFLQETGWDLSSWLTGVRDFTVYQRFFIPEFQVRFILLPEYISNSLLCSHTAISALVQDTNTSSWIAAIPS